MRLVYLLLISLVLAACDDQSAAPAVEAEQKPAPAVSKEPVEQILELDRQSTARPPTLLDPPVEAVMPSGLKTITYAIGNGTIAVAGDLVAVHYTGWLTDTTAADGKGKKFDSSRDRGEPLTFPLGVGKVIKGWDQGLDGMREGGKRTLVIPSDLAYGSRQVGNLIPPNSTLTFDVELVSVSKP